MKPTHATDTFFVRTSPERVFARLLSIEHYDLWWPASLHVRVVSTPPHGEGSVIEIRTLGSRFRCRIAAMEPPRRLVVDYVTGPHRGHGIWTVSPWDGGTKVTYTISLVPHGLPAKLLSHFMDFGALHSRQMRGVFNGLARSALNNDTSV
jgi:uncharacterized protein YndB with AHSA1/START domain